MKSTEKQIRNGSPLGYIVILIWGHPACLFSPLQGIQSIRDILLILSSFLINYIAGHLGTHNTCYQCYQQSYQCFLFNIQSNETDCNQVIGLPNTSWYKEGFWEETLCHFHSGHLRLYLISKSCSTPLFWSKTEYFNLFAREKKMLHICYTYKDWRDNFLENYE